MSVKPVRSSLIRNYLMEEKKIDAGMAEFYADFSMGNVGKAISLSSSEEFNEMREQVFDLLKVIHEAEIGELCERVKQSRTYKDNISEYFDIMRMWFRDLLILKTTGDSERLIFRGEISFLYKQDTQISLAGINKIFDRIRECEARIRANVNYEAAMEVMFLEIRNLFRANG